MNARSPIGTVALTDVSDVNMTSKGQVLIPKGLRDRAGLRPGERLVVGLNDRGEVVVAAGRPAGTAEERAARVRAGLEAIAGTMKTGFGSSDAYMDFIRPWRNDP